MTRWFFDYIILFTNIKGIKPKLNKEKVDGIIDLVSGKDVFDDISYMLDEPIVNFSQSVVDDTVKTNAKFQYESGLNPRIRRISKNNCCEWCNKLAGEYNYKDTIGTDVYRRHTNCNCLVEFIPGNGKKQNVHTKKWSRELKKEVIPIESKKVKEYNKYPVERLKREYKRSVDSGMISALCTFENYYNLYVEIEERIIGKHTGNGILIKSQSKHFLERVVGTGVDPEIYKKKHKKVHRDGVEISDICDALFNGTARKPKETTNGRSQLLISRKCNVSINPDTGVLIQCSPGKE